MVVRRSVPRGVYVTRLHCHDFNPLILCLFLLLVYYCRQLPLGGCSENSCCWSNGRALPPDRYQCIYLTLISMSAVNPPCPILSYPILSCPVLLSYLILSCPLLSNFIVSYLVLFFHHLQFFYDKLHSIFNVIWADIMSNLKWYIFYVLFLCPSI